MRASLVATLVTMRGVRAAGLAGALLDAVGCARLDPDASEHRSGEIFAVTTPPQPAGGGYLVADVTEVSGGRAYVQLFVDGDDQWAGLSLAAFDDADHHAWLAAAPATTYRARVTAGTGGGSIFVEEDDPISYAFAFRYLPIDDVHEPNDTFDAPARLTSGVPANGFLNGRFEDHTFDQGSTADWFVIEGTGSALAVSLSELPDGVRGTLEVFHASDPTDPVSLEIGTAPAAPVSARVETDAGGNWLIRVSAQYDGRLERGSGDLPDLIEQPYTLTVTVEP